MKSFELMETLFTRDCKKEDLFEYIEKEYPYPDFKMRRIMAETITRERNTNCLTLDHVYDVFKELSPDCTSDLFDLLKAYEINLELERSIPIQCNIKQIVEDDIFIEDTYFTKEQWSTLLRKHEIPENKLYLLSESDIPETMVHIGIKDRPHLKVTNAYAFTYTENILYNLPIQKKIRSFRLKNPHPEHEIEYKDYDNQASYTLPILFLFGLHIQKIMTKENRKRALFCSNGIYQLFSTMFPQIESVLFSTSSLIHVHPTLSYKEYVQKLYQDKTSLIVDLHGFFQKEGYVYKDIFGNIPRVHVLVNNIQGQCDFPSLSSSIETSELSMDYIDTLSYDSRGVLFSMIEGNELRLHETKPKPSIESLVSFSELFSELDIDLVMNDLEIPPILLQIIEKAFLR